MIETKGVEIPRYIGLNLPIQKTKEELKLRLKVLFWNQEPNNTGINYKHASFQPQKNQPWTLVPKDQIGIKVLGNQVSAVVGWIKIFNKETQY